MYETSDPVVEETLGWQGLESAENYRFEELPIPPELQAIIDHIGTRTDEQNVVLIIDNLREYCLFVQNLFNEEGVDYKNSQTRPLTTTLRSGISYFRDNSESEKDVEYANELQRLVSEVWPSLDKLLTDELRLHDIYLSRFFGDGDRLSTKRELRMRENGRRILLELVQQFNPRTDGVELFSYLKRKLPTAVLKAESQILPKAVEPTRSTIAEKITPPPATRGAPSKRIVIKKMDKEQIDPVSTLKTRLNSFHGINHIGLTTLEMNIITDIVDRALQPYQIARITGFEPGQVLTMIQAIIYKIDRYTSTLDDNT